MKHRRMESILIIGANYKNWTVKREVDFPKRYLSREKLEPPRLNQKRQLVNA